MAKEKAWDFSKAPYTGWDTEEQEDPDLIYPAKGMQQGQPSRRETQEETPRQSEPQPPTSQIILGRVRYPVAYQQPT